MKKYAVKKGDVVQFKVNLIPATNKSYLEKPKKKGNFVTTTYISPSGDEEIEFMYHESLNLAITEIQKTAQKVRLKIYINSKI